MQSIYPSLVPAGLPAAAATATDRARARSKISAGLELEGSHGASGAPADRGGGINRRTTSLSRQRRRHGCRRGREQPAATVATEPQRARQRMAAPWGKED